MTTHTTVSLSFNAIFIVSIVILIYLYFTKSVKKDLVVCPKPTVCTWDKNPKTGLDEINIPNRVISRAYLFFVKNAEKQRVLMCKKDSILIWLKNSVIKTLALGADVPIEVKINGEDKYSPVPLDEIILRLKDVDFMMCSQEYKEILESDEVKMQLKTSFAEGIPADMDVSDEDKDEMQDIMLSLVFYLSSRYCKGGSIDIDKVLISIDHVVEFMCSNHLNLEKFLAPLKIGLATIDI
jgi:hypothetical protein